MKWSLLIGRFWGTEIRLHASLLLLIPYALLVFKLVDVPGALRAFLILAAIFACVALHEMGHTLAARLFGIHVTSIVLWPLGGFANLTRRPEKTLPDLIISAAGPFANLLLFGGLAVLAVIVRLLEASFRYPSVTHLLWQLDVFAFLVSLAVANLSLAVFNLVPVYPLDGGQIARGLLKAIFGEKRADLILLIISLPLALLLVLAGLLARDIAIILTGLILVLASASLNLHLANGITLAVLYFIDRGAYHLKKEDFDPAVEEYTRAIQRSPNKAVLYVSRAVAYMNLNERSQARVDIESALALDPGSYIAWGLRGELLELDKNYPRALEAFNQAIHLRPNWSLGYLDRGSLYQEMGDLARAEADMNQAIELGRGSPVAFIMRSILRYRLGNLPGVREDADQAMRYAPHWMLVFPEIFQQNMEGNLNWALEYYSRAIQQMPGAYQAYLGRADASRANHRLDWAISDYHRAAQLAPKQAEVYLSRGRTYLQMGLNEQAAADFRAAAHLAEKLHIRRQANALLVSVPTAVGSAVNSVQPPASPQATGSHPTASQALAARVEPGAAPEPGARSASHPEASSPEPSSD